MLKNENRYSAGIWFESGGRIVPSTAWFICMRMLWVCRRLGSEESAAAAPDAPDFSQCAGAEGMPTNDCKRMAVLWSIAAVELLFQMQKARQGAPPESSTALPAAAADDGRFAFGRDAAIAAAAARPLHSAASILTTLRLAASFMSSSAQWSSSTAMAYLWEFNRSEGCCCCCCSCCLPFTCNSGIA